MNFIRRFLFGFAKDNSPSTHVEASVNMRQVTDSYELSTATTGNETPTQHIQCASGQQAASESQLSDEITPAIHQSPIASAKTPSPATRNMCHRSLTANLKASLHPLLNSGITPSKEPEFVEPLVLFKRINNQKLPTGEAYEYLKRCVQKRLTRRVWPANPRSIFHRQGVQQFIKNLPTPRKSIQRQSQSGPRGAYFRPISLRSLQFQCVVIDVPEWFSSQVSHSTPVIKSFSAPNQTKRTFPRRFGSCSTNFQSQLKVPIKSQMQSSKWESSFCQSWFNSDASSSGYNLKLRSWNYRRRWQERHRPAKRTAIGEENNSSHRLQLLLDPATRHRVKELEGFEVRDTTSTKPRKRNLACLESMGSISEKRRRSGSIFRPQVHFR